MGLAKQLLSKYNAQVLQDALEKYGGKMKQTQNPTDNTHVNH
jgi:hypothetical protein